MRRSAYLVIAVLVAQYLFAQRKQQDLLERLRQVGF